MRILSLLAHPAAHSFSRDLVGVLVGVAGEKGHECDFLDLYRENFNPVLSNDDFEEFNRGMTPIDIREQQDRLADADILALFHPIWWFGMPAVLKGWIDRVFSYGFAYGHDSKGIKPLLSGKKLILVNTAGGSEKEGYAQTGIGDAIRTLNDEGIFRFVGFDILLRKFFFEVPAASDEKRREMAEEFRAELWKTL